MIAVKAKASSKTVCSNFAKTVDDIHSLYTLYTFHFCEQKFILRRSLFISVRKCGDTTENCMILEQNKLEYNNIAYLNVQGIRMDTCLLNYIILFTAIK